MLHKNPTAVVSWGCLPHCETLPTKAVDVGAGPHYSIPATNLTFFPERPSMSQSDVTREASESLTYGEHPEFQEKKQKSLHVMWSVRHPVFSTHRPKAHLRPKDAGDYPGARPSENWDLANKHRDFIIGAVFKSLLVMLLYFRGAFATTLSAVNIWQNCFRGAFAVFGLICDNLST